MNIGLIGSGNIGKILARKLSVVGHSVVVSNSRGPDTIDAEALEFGAKAGTVAQAVDTADVVILSVPFVRIPQLKALFISVPPETVLIETSNYYPGRDGAIAAVDQGQTESLWVTEQLGRGVVKAWNAVTAGVFASGGLTFGTPGRLAIPVAADTVEERHVGMALVDETGFDPLDAGSLADSWRFQPGQPAYCAGLAIDAFGSALAGADAEAPKRRDERIQRLIESGFKW